MSKKMLINATHPEENRVAIVDEGILCELDIEVAGKEQTKGNIYKAVVIRVETGLQAAFVDYGAERLGFLQIGELHPSFFQAAEKNSENKGRPRINDLLYRGQELLVQIVKEERGTKGAALTTYLSLPGRYMVLMPESDTKGISRKIEEESQRKALKSAMASMNLPPNMGYIVRTAGIGQQPEELGRDFNFLHRTYEKIISVSKQVSAPALIYKESNLVIRCIRDYFSTDMDEVLVDDSKVFQEAKDFFQEVMPEYARLVKLHQERRPIFARYQIEEQIETISKNKVNLPSGGSIVIDTTEALVAIDVNSGKMASEQGVEATAYKTNLEAAEEVGRQLRLRDLGGLIVIDFIDMRDRKHVREVEKCLKKALQHDKARVTVGRISSQFGLLEMSRQRIKATLAEGTFFDCPHCGGSGRIKSPESQTVALLRKIQAGIAKGQVGRVEGEVPLDVATYLLNHKRGELIDMERRHQLSIVIKGHPELVAGQAELTFQRREKDEPQPEYIDATATNLEARPEVDAEAAPHPAAPGQEGASGTEEPAKKKRRRRRRRKKSAEPAETGAAEASAEAAPGAEPAVEPAAEAAAEPAVEPSTAEQQPAPAEMEPAAEVSAAPAPSEGGEAQEQPPKRQRRRRGPRKKPETQPAAPAAEGASGTSTEVESVAPPLTEEAPGPQAEPQVEKTEELPPAAGPQETPEPQPAGPQKAAEAEAPPAPPEGEIPMEKAIPTEPPAPVTAVTSPPGVEEKAPAEDVSAAAPSEAAAEAPKPQRKRRTARKKTAEAAETEVKAEVATTEAAPAEEKIEVAPKPQRKRRTMRKKTEETAEAKAEAPATEAAPAAETAEEALKPQRKRRTTRKKTEEVSETKAEAATTETAPAAEAAEEAPKPQRKRRTTRKKTEETAETKAEAATTETTPTAEAAEEAPKPRKRRTTRKKTEETAEAKAEAAPNETTPATVEAPKPQRKRRTTRKKTEETSEAKAEVAATETAPTAEAAEKAPKPRKRRTTRKKTEETAEAKIEAPATETTPAAEATEEAPKPQRKRRTPRKKTETQEVSEKDQPEPS